MQGFETNYDQRLDSLIQRRTAPVEILAKGATLGFPSPQVNEYSASPTYELYNRLDEGPAVRYAVGAMARIDPRYTDITYEQGERIKRHLDKALTAAGASCDFEYQGSVTNDTHIKSHSDIDLLVITKLFYFLEPPQVPPVPYKGNVKEDLMKVRTTSCDCLTSAFPAAKVDKSGAKCVAISGGSLERKVDIVPANWLNTNEFARLQAKRYRAVEVFNCKTGERVRNTPFLHNYHIEKKDVRSVGGLRKVVRLMKSLKYDSDEVSLTSYDITAIGYHMPEIDLITSPGEEVALLHRLARYLDFLSGNETVRFSMMVPDESRKVFSAGHATLDGLNQLRIEVSGLIDAIAKERKARARSTSSVRLIH